MRMAVVLVVLTTGSRTRSVAVGSSWEQISSRPLRVWLLMACHAWFACLPRVRPPQCARACCGSSRRARPPSPHTPPPATRVPPAVRKGMLWFLTPRAPAVLSPGVAPRARWPPPPPLLPEDAATADPALPLDPSGMAGRGLQDATAGGGHHPEFVLISQPRRDRANAQVRPLFFSPPLSHCDNPPSSTSGVHGRFEAWVRRACAERVCGADVLVCLRSFGSQVAEALARAWQQQLLQEQQRQQAAEAAAAAAAAAARPPPPHRHANGLVPPWAAFGKAAAATNGWHGAAVPNGKPMANGHAANGWGGPPPPPLPQQQQVERAPLLVAGAPGAVGLKVAAGGVYSPQHPHLMGVRRRDSDPSSLDLAEEGPEVRFLWGGPCYALALGTATRAAWTWRRKGQRCAFFLRGLRLLLRFSFSDSDPTSLDVAEEPEALLLFGSGEPAVRFFVLHRTALLHAHALAPPRCPNRYKIPHTHTHCVRAPQVWDEEEEDEALAELELERERLAQEMDRDHEEEEDDGEPQDADTGRSQAQNHHLHGGGGDGGEREPEELSSSRRRRHRKAAAAAARRRAGHSASQHHHLYAPASEGVPSTSSPASFTSVVVLPQAAAAASPPPHANSIFFQHQASLGAPAAPAPGVQEGSAGHLAAAAAAGDFARAQSLQSFRFAAPPPAASAASSTAAAAHGVNPIRGLAAAASHLLRASRSFSLPISPAAGAGAASATAAGSADGDGGGSAHAHRHHHHHGHHRDGPWRLLPHAHTSHPPEPPPPAAVSLDGDRAFEPRTDPHPPPRLGSAPKPHDAHAPSPNHHHHHYQPQHHGSQAHHPQHALPRQQSTSSPGTLQPTFSAHPHLRPGAAAAAAAAAAAPLRVASPQPYPHVTNNVLYSPPEYCELATPGGSLPDGSPLTSTTRLDSSSFSGSTDGERGGGGGVSDGARRGRRRRRHRSRPGRHRSGAGDGDDAGQRRRHRSRRRAAGDAAAAEQLQPRQQQRLEAGQRGRAGGGWAAWFSPGAWWEWGTGRGRHHHAPHRQQQQHPQHAQHGAASDAVLSGAGSGTLSQRASLETRHSPHYPHHHLHQQQHFHPHHAHSQPALPAPVVAGPFAAATATSAPATAGGDEAIDAAAAAALAAAAASGWLPAGGAEQGPPVGRGGGGAPPALTVAIPSSDGGGSDRGSGAPGTATAAAATTAAAPQQQHGGLLAAVAGLLGSPGLSAIQEEGPLSARMSAYHSSKGSQVRFACRDRAGGVVPADLRTEETLQHTKTPLPCAVFPFFAAAARAGVGRRLLPHQPGRAAHGERHHCRRHLASSHRPHNSGRGAALAAPAAPPAAAAGRAEQRSVTRPAPGSAGRGRRRAAAAALCRVGAGASGRRRGGAAVATGGGERRPGR